MTKTSAPVEDYVMYVADCADLTFQSIEIPWNATFPSVTLRSTARDTLTIWLECSTSKDLDQTLHDGLSVVEGITSELAYRFSCRIGNPIQTGCHVPFIDSQGGFKWHVGTSFTSAWRCSGIPKKRLEVSEVAEVVAAARDLSSPRRASCLALYRSARAAKDPIARFVLWYATLQYVIDADYQDDVDDWIRVHDDQQPRLQEVPKPPHARKRPKHEPYLTTTSYTSTRDSLAHVQEEPHGFSTALHIATNLSVRLEHLVTLAISDECPPSP